MAGPVVFKLNRENVGDLLNGTADARVEAELLRRGQAIAAHACTLAGLPADSFVAVIDRGGTRVRCRVITATADAMVAEARDRVLTRAFDAGRG